MLNKLDKETYTAWICSQAYNIFKFTIQTFMSIIAPNYVNDMGWHNHNADNFSLTHNKNNFETYAI